MNFSDDVTAGEPNKKETMTKKIPCSELQIPKPHYWLLEPNRSRKSNAVCKHCGYSNKELNRTFWNFNEEGNKTRRKVNGHYVMVNNFVVGKGQIDTARRGNVR